MVFLMRLSYRHFHLSYGTLEKAKVYNTCGEHERCLWVRSLTHLKFIMISIINIMSTISSIITIGLLSPCI